MGNKDGKSSFVFLSIVLAFSSFILEVNTDHVTYGTLYNIDHVKSDGISIPVSMELKVRVEENDVHLRLNQALNSNDDIPLFILTKDEVSGLGKIRVPLKKPTDHGLYYDADNRAAFRAYHDKDENGTTSLFLEGVFGAAGKMYDIKSTGRYVLQQNQRRRRDVDNSTDENSVAGQELQHEFQVKKNDPRVLDDFADIKKSPIFQNKRVMQNMSAPLLPHAPSPVRRKRQTIRDVTVDICAIVDYAIYKSWYDRSTATTTSAKQQDALIRIRQYYAFIFHGVNMLYQSIRTLPYNIAVRLTSIMIATTPSASDWTERYKVATTSRYRLDASKALMNFGDWVGTTDTRMNYDHVMLFSGYDLTKTETDGSLSDKITGLAFTGTVCDLNGKSTSLVEDLGGFQCMHTAGHELGHSMQADHDGTGNACKSEDRYIMSAGSYPETPTNKDHIWEFSSCSLQYFNDFIANSLKTSRGSQCLGNALPINSSIPDVSNIMEGQLYNPDEQCRQAYGPQSRLCRGSEFGAISEICTDMFCYDPTTNSTCYQLVAARGTSCGDKKWCVSGKCVYDTNAPSKQSDCVFGDQPGVAFQDMNCSTFVAKFPGYCYQNVVRDRCCTSCSKYYRSVLDCAYGDKASGCSAIGCRQSDTDYRQQCCGTCNYGSPIPSTTTVRNPTTITATVRGLAASIRTSNNLPTTTTSPTTLCQDNSSVTFNGMACSALVDSNPDACYNTQVQTYCCGSCQRIYRNVKDCEYGDRNLSECKGTNQTETSCYRLRHVCCQSCSSFLSSRGQSIRAAFSLALVLFLAVAAFTSS